MRVLFEGEPPVVLPSELWCYRAGAGRVVLGGALSDGGGLYEWMKETLALDVEDAMIEHALDGMQPDAHGLTVMPFWAGERSTGWHASARGAIMGLTMHTRPLDMMRAAMEAVAYRLALIAGTLDEFAPDATIVASGGALRASRVWTQILADVMGRPLALSGVDEASSRGAVLLALEATGKIGSIADAPISFAQTFEPDPSRHAFYRAGMERQREMYERLVADEDVARIVGGATLDE
jgi:gluconokinase